jgi:uncharacterized protein (TIGR02421 family)
MALQQAELKYRHPSTRLAALAREQWLQDVPVEPGENADLVRVSVPSVYYQSDGQHTFPELLESVSAALYDGLLQGVYEYSRRSGLATPPHHRAYGRNVLVKAAKHIDKQIAELCDSFDFLLSVTPINTQQCWHEFEAAGYQAIPDFRYRPLAVSTSEVKRALHAINVNLIEDPVLIRLFQEKQHELDHQLTMLQLRCDSRFKHATMLVYGEVCSAEQATAREILEAIEGRHPDGECLVPTLDCHQILARAREWVARYQKRYPAFTPRLQIRDDLPAGLLVSGDQLMISRLSTVPEPRVDALLSHEIGVHLVTYFAGAAQPLEIFRSGLAGYEGIQEVLGVFAEYLAGGLSAARLRLLAARVMAVASMLAGADFVETFRMLHHQFHIAASNAFGIAMRVHRSGGLAKDAIYLRGLNGVLEILSRQGQLDAFWVGKIAPHHIADVDELIHRGLLIKDTVKPLFLEHQRCKDRMEGACNQLQAIDLLPNPRPMQ